MQILSLFFVFGNRCYTEKIIKVDENGKCITYEKDTPENIKLAKSNKFKMRNKL